MMSSQGECTTEGGCINENPADNITARVSFVFSRTIPINAAGDTNDDSFTWPDQNELYDVPLDGIKLYGKTRVQGICILAIDLGGSVLEIDTCESKRDEWVPVFLEGYEPQMFAQGEWPNQYIPGPSYSAAIDCSVILHGEQWEFSAAQSKIISLPIGASGGPCWYDETYGTEACSEGAAPGTSRYVQDYVTMDGEPFPGCEDGMDPKTCDRYFFFNCPQASSSLHKKDF